MMNRYLSTNCLDQFRRSLDETTQLLDTITCPVSTLCALSPGDELHKMLEILEIYKQIRNEQNSYAKLTIYELLPGRTEENQTLTDGRRSPGAFPYFEAPPGYTRNTMPLHFEIM